MGTRPLLPPQLLRGPFTVTQARAAGLARWHLEGESWKRLGPSVYAWAGLQDDPLHRLQAALRRLPAGAVLSGRSAGWLHGMDVTPCDPIEATVPLGSGVSGRSGMKVRRSPLATTDVTRVRGLPATSIVRTIAELCARLALVEAVVILDAALHSRRVRLDDVQAWLNGSAGRKGVRGLRSVLDHAEPAAESPMESRLRMVLVLGGLPRPRAQVAIHDAWGAFIGRADLYYDQHRLGIEYDGAIHRESLAQDNRRQNNLLRSGVRLLRFTADDVLRHPASVVGQVRELLAQPASAGKRGLESMPRPASAGTRGLHAR